MFPSTVEELSEEVRDACEHGQPLVPWGAGTRQYIGGLPAKETSVLHMRGLDRLVAHVPADMTVTVEAGMAIGDLQARLRAHGQWLPWDPPASSEATIGGLLASAAAGPLRLGYGTPRDWVLGMRAVLGDGRIVKSGGNVVKNVAGYDLHKLHIGSLGTLGIIAEVTLKVFPASEHFGSIAAFAADLATALAYAEIFRAAPLAPVCLLVASEVGGGFQVFARYAGVEAGVQRQTALAHARVAGSHALEADNAVWARHAKFAQPQQESTIILRAGAAPAKLVYILAALGDHAPANSTLVAYAGVGIAYARWPATEDLAVRLHTLRLALQAHGGYAVVEHAPASRSKTLDLWGPAPPTLPLMRALKAQWDPRGILNPARYLI